MKDGYSHSGCPLFKCRPCAKEVAQKYRHTEHGRQRVNERMAKYRMLPEVQVKDRARIVVNLAVRRGELHPKVCHCGNRKSEAHHHDYSKPLEVEWLCRQCHADLHRKYEISHTSL